MRRGQWAELGTALFVLALVYLMVKPGSLAGTFVTAFGDATADIVSYAVTG